MEIRNTDELFVPSVPNVSRVPNVPRALEEDLRKNIEGEVHFDAVHRQVYSVDASIYEITPIGIVLPRTTKDLLTTLRIAYNYGIPVIARGAATGITGGCIGYGLIIDTSKYLNRILHIDFEAEYAECEPGVVQDRLNDALSAHGYRLGPDTSTGNRATLGGMLGNNAAGARSLRYGTMADHVIGVELALASGECLNFHQLSETEWKQKCLQTDAEGRIYNAIDQIREQYHDEIKKRFPHIPRRVSGYNLDALIQPGTPNLCRLITGSEGSLGIATKIRVKISRKPQVTGLCIIHLHDMIDGMRDIPKMLAYNPLAIELIDNQIIAMGRSSPSMRGNLEWLKGNPEALFVVEFDGETSSDVQQKLSSFEQAMQKHNIGFAYTSITDPRKMNQVWQLRKSGLGLLLSKRSYSRAISFLEDVTVAPQQLASFIGKFREYLRSHGKTAGIYGHVGSGCMHVRPYIDLRQSDDVKLMEQMMYDISDMLLAHGGALSGEHGDGLVRSWLNKKMFGDRLYQAFLDLKAAFDPENRMNPGKVVNGPPFLENLRLDPKTPIKTISTFLDFSREGGFELAADLCNGNGLCRKSEKVMCPSFQASGDEFHTTRARAQALRSVIHSRLPLKDFTSQGLHDVLDLCLECKGCKTECPSEVDMAKMKAEFLYHYHKEHGTPVRNHLFANIGKINHLASHLPLLFNAFSQTFISRWIQSAIGIAPQRSLPKIARQRFSDWFRTRSIAKGQPVVLFNDTFTEFNQPEIGKAAVHVLEALGYQVMVPPWHCCGRPAFSKGELVKAKKMAKESTALLASYAKAKIPIIGLEPSCILTIKDDYFGLLGSDPNLELIHQQCRTFDDFIAQHVNNGQLPIPLSSSDQSYLLHGHCHQKSLEGTESTIKVLRALPNSQVKEIESGCCGMAGSFGYEKEHYHFSMKIGELKLFPAVRSEPDETIIVANGISCRNQIEQGTKRNALHLAEAIQRLMSRH